MVKSTALQCPSFSCVVWRAVAVSSKTFHESQHFYSHTFWQSRTKTSRRLCSIWISTESAQPLNLFSVWARNRTAGTSLCRTVSYLPLASGRVFVLILIVAWASGYLARTTAWAFSKGKAALFSKLLHLSNISFCKPQLIPHAVKRTPDAVSNVLCCLSWPAECPHVFQFVHMDVGVLWQWKDGFKQKKNRRTWRCMFSTNDVEKALCPVHIACRLFPEAWRNRDIWQIEPCKSICESMCRQRMIEWIWQALETLRVWVRWHEYGCSRLNVATSRQMQHSL